MASPLASPVACAKVKQALSNDHSRSVLAACMRNARRVKDVSRETGLPLPTTYRHVHALVEAGLLVVERSAFTPDGKRYELYRSRVKSARILLDDSGEHVEWVADSAIEARMNRLQEALAASSPA